MKQTAVLKKIREKGRVNGYDVELAEAQARDFSDMNKRIGNIEERLGRVETGMATLDGKIDTVIKLLNGGMDEIHKEGMVWHEIKSFLKSKTFFILLLILIGCIALSGNNILSVIGLATKVGV